MYKIFAISILAALAITFSASAKNLNSSLALAEELIEEAIFDNNEYDENETSLDIRIAKGRADLERSGSEDLELTSLEIDSDKKTFSGFILSSEFIPFEITGKYTEMVQIPVMLRKVSRDDIIGGGDITYVAIDSKKLSRGYVTDESELIGKSPTRTLFKKRPIMPSQIAEPTLIKKKETVTMIFRNNLLQMQDIGVAMQDGGAGDLIRIRNGNSNIIVNARVLNSGLVEVESGQQHMAFNN